MKRLLGCAVVWLMAGFPVASHEPVAQPQVEVPVYKVVPLDSAVKFAVKASVALEGTFEKWDATLTFASADVTTAKVVIRIQAGSVNTGSGMKDKKLRSKDFFAVEENPEITFISKRVVQTGPTTFEVAGDFTIRGVTKDEKLELSVAGKGTGNGLVHGTMGFDRKDYGMDKGIPFIKIADRVEVTVNLRAQQVSGPRLVYKE